MRYYHILALGLFTLFTSCRMYEDMPSGDNYVSPRTPRAYVSSYAPVSTAGC